MIKFTLSTFLILLVCVTCMERFFNDQPIMFDHKICPYLDRKELFALSLVSRCFYLNQTPNIKIAVKMTATLQFFLSYRYDKRKHHRETFALDFIKFPLMFQPLSLTYNNSRKFTIGFHDVKEIHFPSSDFNGNIQVQNIFFGYSEKGIFTDVSLQYRSGLISPPTWYSKTEKLHFYLYPQNSTKYCTINCYLISKTDDRTLIKLYISFYAKAFFIEACPYQPPVSKKQHVVFSAKLLKSENSTSHII